MKYTVLSWFGCLHVNTPSSFLFLILLGYFLKDSQEDPTSKGGANYMSRTRDTSQPQHSGQPAGDDYELVAIQVTALCTTVYCVDTIVRQLPSVIFVGCVMITSACELC